MDEPSPATRHYVDNEIRHLRELMEARFDGLDAKLDGMSAKLDGMSAKLDALLALYTPLIASVRRMQKDIAGLQELLRNKPPLGFCEEQEPYGGSSRGRDT